MLCPVVSGRNGKIRIYSPLEFTRFPDLMNSPFTKSSNRQPKLPLCCWDLCRFMGIIFVQKNHLSIYYVLYSQVFPFLKLPQNAMNGSKSIAIFKVLHKIFDFSLDGILEIKLIYDLKQMPNNERHKVRPARGSN